MPVDQAPLSTLPVSDDGKTDQPPKEKKFDESIGSSPLSHEATKGLGEGNTAKLDCGRATTESEGRWFVL